MQYALKERFLQPLLANTYMYRYLYVYLPAFISPLCCHEINTNFGLEIIEIIFSYFSTHFYIVCLSSSYPPLLDFSTSLALWKSNSSFRSCHITATDNINLRIIVYMTFSYCHQTCNTYNFFHSNFITTATKYAQQLYTYILTIFVCEHISEFQLCHIHISMYKHC